jgi:hypothetical protein
MAQIVCEIHDRHAALPKFPFDRIAAGQAAVETLHEVVHWQEICKIGERTPVASSDLAL